MPDIVTASGAVTHTEPASPDVGYAHNLVDLQADAFEHYGMTRAQTLAAAISLYERGLITYPKSEERLLLERHFDEASRIVSGYKLASGSRAHDTNYKAPCWVDEVLGAHHGITLTNAPAGALFGVGLSEDEARIYGLVHVRFLGLFRRPA